MDHARVECANHWFVYNADMKVESVAQAVSNLAIRFGDSDDDGPAMVCVCMCVCVYVCVFLFLFFSLLHFFNIFFNSYPSNKHTHKQTPTYPSLPHQSRPFGVAMLFAGIDNCGAQLYHMDPSGTFLEFGAKAIGSGSEGAQQSLQESYHKVCMCMCVCNNNTHSLFLSPSLYLSPNPSISIQKTYIYLYL